MLKTVELSYIFVETKHDTNMIFSLLQYMEFTVYGIYFYSIIYFVIVTIDSFNVLAE